MDSLSFPDAVAQYLKQTRQQHGLTLDAVAKAGREYGASWGVASIRNIENGDASLTLPLLLTLALALGDLTEQPIRLQDLLGDAQAIDLPTWAPDNYPVKREWYDRVLGGEEVDLRAGDLVGAVREPGKRNFPLTSKDLATLRSKLKELPLSPRPPGTRISFLAAYSGDTSLAEDRAAENLGVHPLILRAWADHLWNTPSIETEAARRAEKKAALSGKPVTAQARGAATRVLLEELRKSIAAQTEADSRKKDGSPA